MTLHMSTAPPPGTPRRAYLFAKVNSDFEAQGFLDHLHELGDLIDRSDNEDADDGSAIVPEVWSAAVGDSS